MIDLNKELKRLKARAKELMKVGDIQLYVQTLARITQLQLTLVSTAR